MSKFIVSKSDLLSLWMALWKSISLNFKEMRCDENPYCPCFQRTIFLCAVFDPSTTNSPAHQTPFGSIVSWRTFSFKSRIIFVRQSDWEGQYPNLKSGQRWHTTLIRIHKFILALIGSSFPILHRNSHVFWFSVSLTK